METPKTQTRPRSHHHIPKTHAALALILIGLSPVIAHGQEHPANPDVINAQNRAHSAGTEADVQAEAEKAAAWTRQKYQNVKESMRTPDAGTPARPDTQVNPGTNAVSSPAPAHQANPSSEITPEKKAAIRTLEAEIARLKQHARSLPQGERRTILERRLEAIEDRKDELESNFTQARWEALVADLKRERDELTR